WRRPPDEVRYLMNFNEGILTRHRDDLAQKGVRIRFAGRRDWRVPKRLLRHMDDSTALTAHNRRMTLTICFNYGGRAEIVDAVRAIVAEGLRPEKVDERAIRNRLYWPDMPDPDLVVRTSGEFRMSNFLLWQLAYSELVFSEVLWPDFRRENLFEAIREYQRRERRYGGLKR
ncbi:MAG TPA: polyprenyl diphosphate synthase, partial [Acidimicrobiales bacterium]|nr:polyprenyl diphosphate synthase [Acidimicrobiales bacterium]